ncbi:universal stress protein [Rhizobium paranaense]|uniref:Nucleotide-binding universal stress UspA family protein n=1 Tax=Rhizobium paranaense TaxID=1650438 RepID=A0A7W9D369_9HYPH|nr:universal stress protein [Rhizobium paranaense]MBB5576062.1 nucleotide-binding universal stress UspA family protein [Rhizobium paranaense]
MRAKTVLSIIGINQDNEDLRSAIELCRAAGAHLSVLVTALAIAPVGGYGEISSSAWAEERERELQKLGEQVAAARTVLQASGISYDVDSLFTEYGWVENEIGERARYADVTLVGGDLLAQDDMRWRILNGALFYSPAPILIVPKGCEASLRPRRVLVAWDSRNEASHAVRAAMEQLTVAENVHVAIVDPHASIRANGEEPGADIAAFLARHGIHVSVDVLAGGGRSVADILRQHAVDIGADLIVMGAYGHSRMRERIFGGTTRSMLEAAPVPLMMTR